MRDTQEWSSTPDFPNSLPCCWTGLLGTVSFVLQLSPASCALVPPHLAHEVSTGYREMPLLESLVCHFAHSASHIFHTKAVLPSHHCVASIQQRNEFLQLRPHYCWHQLLTGVLMPV